MPYRPGKLPSLTNPDAIALAQYFEDELLTLSRGLIENVTEVALSPIFAAPKKPREGMVVYADGTLWNPGSGEGLYVYSSGGTWIWLEDNPAAYVPPTLQICRVALTLSQTIASLTTRTKILYDTVSFDPFSIWDATNHRIKPTVAGYYQVNFHAALASSGGSTEGFGITQKSGSGTDLFDNSLIQVASGATAVIVSTGSDIVHFNGTTDYIEAFAFFQAGTGTLTCTGGVNLNFLSLCCVKAD